MASQPWERAARAEAEAAGRLKDEFLANVSHELRTPLNAMLGWVHLLRSRGLDEATAARGLEVIDRNVRAQKQLVDDLLDVSRIITGRLRIEARPVDLVPVVEAADVLLQSHMAQVLCLATGKRLERRRQGTRFREYGIVHEHGDKRYAGAAPQG